MRLEMSCCLRSLHQMENCRAEAARLHCIPAFDELLVELVTLGLLRAQEGFERCLLLRVWAHFGVRRQGHLLRFFGPGWPGLFVGFGVALPGLALLAILPQLAVLAPMMVGRLRRQRAFWRWLAQYLQQRRGQVLGFGQRVKERGALIGRK